MRIVLCISILMSLCACQSAVEYSEPSIFDDSTDSWVASENRQDDKLVNLDWYKSYSTVEVDKLVNQVVANNLSIKQQTVALKIQEKRTDNASAELWPTLSLDFNARRQQGAERISSSQTLNLNAAYELDIWGKLSAQEQIQVYELLSARALYEKTQQAIIGQVLTTYAQVLEANQLLQLFTQRIENSKQNLTIIESSYQQGLNSALDVYLARNDLNSDMARAAQQRNISLGLVRDLENILGYYPKGEMLFEGNIPKISSNLSAGVPADIAKNNPSLQISWLQLLSANESVAVAHKQRFPSFKLTASVGKASEDIGELLSSDIIWSMLGSIVTPLFNAGKLANNEDIAALNAQQAELSYINEMRNTFLAVENALFQEETLQTRFKNFTAAKENALAAEELSFEQYQKGLVNYTTVLAAQQRSVEAQSSLIQIQSQLFSNRIQLHIALGSGFDSVVRTDKRTNEQN